MYNGPERRKTMDEDLQQLRVEMASFTSKVNSWMETTQEYRVTLCSKIDTMDKKIDLSNTKIFELPCKERRAWYSAINKQLAFLWGITGAVAIKIIADWMHKQ